jgi:hypothetical protein
MKPLAMDTISPAEPTPSVRCCFCCRSERQFGIITGLSAVAVIAIVLSTTLSLLLPPISVQSEGDAVIHNTVTLRGRRRFLFRGDLAVLGELHVEEGGVLVVEGALHVNGTLTVTDGALQVATGQATGAQAFLVDGQGVLRLVRSSWSGGSWGQWNFMGNATVVYEDSPQRTCGPWTAAANNVRLTVRRAPFCGTIWDTAQWVVEDSPAFFPELYANEGEVLLVDGMKPGFVDALDLPGAGSSGIGWRVRVRRTQVTSVGTGAGPGGVVRLKGARDVNACQPMYGPCFDPSAVFKVSGATIGMHERFNLSLVAGRESGVGECVSSHVLEDTSLRGWCLHSHNNITLCVRESWEDDINHNSGTTCQDHRGVLTNVLIAFEQAQIRTTDSIVRGDVSAFAQSTVCLVRTKVLGKISADPTARVIQTDDESDCPFRCACGPAGQAGWDLGDWQPADCERLGGSAAACAFSHSAGLIALVAILGMAAAAGCVVAAAWLLCGRKRGPCHECCRDRACLGGKTGAWRNCCCGAGCCCGVCARCCALSPEQVAIVR